MLRTRKGNDGMETVFVQHDIELELLRSDGCDDCGVPLSEVYDMGGPVAIYGLFDMGDLVGFLCPDCKQAEREWNNGGIDYES